MNNLEGGRDNKRAGILPTLALLGTLAVNTNVAEANNDEASGDTGGGQASEETLYDECSDSATRVENFIFHEIEKIQEALSIILPSVRIREVTEKVLLACLDPNSHEYKPTVEGQAECVSQKEIMKMPSIGEMQRKSIRNNDNNRSLGEKLEACIAWVSDRASFLEILKNGSKPFAQKAAEIQEARAKALKEVERRLDSLYVED